MTGDSLQEVAHSALRRYDNQNDQQRDPQQSAPGFSAG
jgi:hypothetical protein